MKSLICFLFLFGTIVCSQCTEKDKASGVQTKAFCQSLATADGTATGCFPAVGGGCEEVALCSTIKTEKITKLKCAKYPVSKNKATTHGCTVGPSGGCQEAELCENPINDGTNEKCGQRVVYTSAKKCVYNENQSKCEEAPVSCSEAVGNVKDPANECSKLELSDKTRKFCSINGSSNEGCLEIEMICTDIDNSYLKGELLCSNLKVTNKKFECIDDEKTGGCKQYDPNAVEEPEPEPSGIELSEGPTGENDDSEEENNLDSPQTNTSLELLSENSAKGLKYSALIILALLF